VSAKVHLSVCGHVKHGKSTLAGRLAFELRGLSERELEAYSEEALAKGKDFNKYSMVFLKNRPRTYGSTGEADDQSRTVVPAWSASLSVSDITLTIIDVPGHDYYLDNIVYGAYLADVAIVVVEIQDGVVGELHRICRILKAFGIQTIAFCVTKMDQVNYSELRFLEVEAQIRESMISQYDLPPDTPVIPVSALSENGEGVLSKHGGDNLRWYRGPCLLDILSLLKAHGLGSNQKPVRLAVEGRSEVFSAEGVGTVVVGTLEYGSLSKGVALKVEPASTLSGTPVTRRVKSVWIAKGVTSVKVQPDDQTVGARELVSVSFSSYDRKTAEKDFRHGGVLGTEETGVAKLIFAEVYFFEDERVYAGKQYKIYPHGAWAMGQFVRILERREMNISVKIRAMSLPETDREPKQIFGRQSNQVDKETRFAKGEQVMAEILFQRPICIEEARSFPRLGRFIIREKNTIIGCGICARILEKWNE